MHVGAAIHDVGVEVAGPAGEHAPGKVVGVDGRGLGAVEGIGVGVDEGADAAQDAHALLRHHAVAIRADIEQVVAAAAVDAREQLDHLRRGLPVVVVLFVAPGAVERGRHFPVARVGQRGHEVVRGTHVLAQLVADAAADDAVGLQGLDQIVDATALFLGHAHGRVEPHQADLAVVGQQFAQLGQALVAVVLAVVLLAVGLAVAKAVFLVPVLRLRVVDAQFHPRLAAGVGQLAERVAAKGRGIYDVVGGAAGMVHGKAVVMLGGEDDVLHARILRQTHDGPGVEALRVKLFGQRAVFLHGYLQMAHDPLGHLRRLLALPFAAEQRIQPPVDEHAEAGVLPPLLFTILHSRPPYLFKPFPPRLPRACARRA